MKYLCQVWFESSTLEIMSTPDKQNLDRDSLAYDRDLKASGHMIVAEALQSPRSAVTVKVRDGKTITTDGPFAETKEALGGFYMLNTKDLDEALELAAMIPGAAVGSIEVRPIMEFPG